VYSAADSGNPAQAPNEEFMPKDEVLVSEEAIGGFFRASLSDLGGRIN